MKIKCAYKEILDIDDPRLVPNPENPNDHSKKQIEQFAKILKYQGQRKPIVISNLSGFIATGHGTLMAAKEAGAKQIAVDFQDFDNEAQEYAHVVADNAIAFQSELDRSMIEEKLEDLDENFDVELFGIEDYTSEINTEIENENIYTDKVSRPSYTPKKDSAPPLSELFNTDKYFDLVKQIKEKKLPADIELFLTFAASRHIVFNYENIAEFYCHQNIDVQNLMEKSALVIIDFEKAVEEGFIKLTSEIQESFDENNSEMEDE